MPLASGGRHLITGLIKFQPLFGKHVCNPPIDVRGAKIEPSNKHTQGFLITISFQYTGFIKNLAQGQTALSTLQNNTYTTNRSCNTYALLAFVTGVMSSKGRTLNFLIRRYPVEFGHYHATLKSWVIILVYRD